MKRDDDNEYPIWILAIAVLVMALAAVVLLGGCSGLKVEGECTYERTITTSYHCPAGGKVEHYRLAPGVPEP